MSSLVPVWSTSVFKMQDSNFCSVWRILTEAKVDSYNTVFVQMLVTSVLSLNHGYAAKVAMLYR